MADTNESSGDALPDELVAKNSELTKQNKQLSAKVKELEKQLEKKTLEAKELEAGLKQSDTRLANREGELKKLLAAQPKGPTGTVVFEGTIKDAVHQFNHKYLFDGDLVVVTR